MTFKTFHLFSVFLILLIIGCKDQPSTKNKEVPQVQTKSDSLDSLKTEAEKKTGEVEVVKEVEKEEEPFKLTEDNAIEFFYEYNKTLTENTVKLTTRFGDIIIELYDNVPYHKANFIYLTKNGYFNNTYFHRVVKDFIIQGGNADNMETAKKRGEIGRYLLPPDTRKGHKHHRGTISMPSSDMDNPHKLASPYEFFIVVTKPGSYHLDNNYTPFGRVIEGMDVVDEINRQPVDNGDWPSQNIIIQKAEVIN
ncbi:MULTISPECIES: peptidylprolyl isomerase [Arenibacter]|uniref:peptidylprolyl isomerase n=1 Tax=Arenibacter TaxID=178469 RepID=UPI000A386BBB|nr:MULTISPECIES: peptidylprolyl isomerase [Arenibacter]